MNKKATELLEYYKIKNDLKSYALSDLGREMIDKMEPYLDMSLIERYLEETTEARGIVDISSNIPIHSLKGVDNLKCKFGKGMVLSPEDLELIAGLLSEGKKLKKFMKDKNHIAPNISTYAMAIYDLEDLYYEIDKCIVNGRVDDRASSQLAKIRKKAIIIETRIKAKLDSIIHNPKFKSCIQDSIISMRDGRYVVSVKNEYKRNIGGNVLDSSGSGSTVFIEPEEVKRLHDELNICRGEEENEVYRILSTLTGTVEAYEKEISINIETMAYYDFIFAKAKYSKAIDGRSVKLNMSNYINIIDGKHPLIGKDAVPLNFHIGDGYRSLLITGPNTGGKTVVLKTVGLLTMMVQSGLHVPVGEGSEFSIFIDILADIGDGQSIEQSLSTFSSHVKNIIDVLDCADEHSLVILDEVGAGTDPGEGMGLAIAVFEKLYEKGTTILATTHYSEIKTFAKDHEGFKNGCMEFDLSTLRPLYRLTIGEPGESNALLIAIRLGMEKSLIERAHEVTYKEKKDYGDCLKNGFMKAPEDNAIELHKQQAEELAKIERNRSITNKQKMQPKFNIGDCVYISDMNRTGIVCEPENGKGELGIMVMKRKLKINHKRLSLYVDGKALYPEDYDFDVIFESKQNRKNKKLMGKRHIDGIEIKIRE